MFRGYMDCYFPARAGRFQGVCAPSENKVERENSSSVLCGLVSRLCSCHRKTGLDHVVT